MSVKCGMYNEVKREGNVNTQCLQIWAEINASNGNKQTLAHKIISYTHVLHYQFYIFVMNYKIDNVEHEYIKI